MAAICGKQERTRRAKRRRVRHVQEVCDLLKTMLAGLSFGKSKDREALLRNGLLASCVGAS